MAKVSARDVESRDIIPHTQLRLLQELEVSNESPETFRFEAELYESQTPVDSLLNMDTQDLQDVGRL